MKQQPIIDYIGMNISISMKDVSEDMKNTDN